MRRGHFIEEILMVCCLYFGEEVRVSSRSLTCSSQRDRRRLTVFYKDNVWMCFDCKDGHVASRVMSGRMNEVLLCYFFAFPTNLPYLSGR